MITWKNPLYSEMLRTNISEQTPDALDRSGKRGNKHNAKSNNHNHVEVGIKWRHGQARLNLLIVPHDRGSSAVAASAVDDIDDHGDYKYPCAYVFSNFLQLFF